MRAPVQVRSGYVVLLAVVGLCIAALQPVLAATVTITLVRLTSPVTAGQDARIDIMTLPNASCSIVVRYKSGPSKAKGLVAKMADGKGAVSWRWRVGSSTTPGRWPVIITCTKGGDQGELKTAIETR